jgi:hypothetical protein
MMRICRKPVARQPVAWVLRTIREACVKNDVIMPKLVAIRQLQAARCGGIVQKRQTLSPSD